MSSVKPIINTKVSQGLSRRPMRKSVNWQRRLRSLLKRRISWRSAILIIVLTVIVGIWLLLIYAHGFNLNEQKKALNEWGVKTVNGLSVLAGFQIKSISVSPVRYISEQQIMDQMAIRPGQSIIFFNKHAVQKKVEQLGWVKSANIQIFYPRTLHIYIEEEEFYAFWKSKGEIWIINAAGKKITPSDLSRVGNKLPVFVGMNANKHARALNNLLYHFPEILQRTVSAVRIDDRRWDLVFKSGHVMALPEENLLPALYRLKKVLNKTQLLENRPKWIDLRLSDRITFKELKS